MLDGKERLIIRDDIENDAELFQQKVASVVVLFTLIHIKCIVWL